MAINENAPVTAIAESIHVYLGEMGAGETLSSTFEDLGIVDVDSLTITTADGTVIELKDINGELIDRIKQQPTITVGFTLLKPSEKTRGKFWEIREAGTGDTRKVQVVSLVQNKPMSLKFANIENVGSETFEAPKCSVSMNLAYAANKGYTGACSVILMKPQRATAEKPELFQFGVVPTPAAKTAPRG